MKKKKFIAVYTAIALVAVLILAAGGYSYENADETPTVTDSLPVVGGTGRFNILVAGTDRTSGLTDVLILASVNRGDNSVSIMQIPRDTYARYTEKSYKKLNGAYGELGGGRALCNMLSGAFALPIHKYIVLSPDAVRGIVDAVGGVTVELAEPMNYRDPYQDLVISLPAGRQTLDGKGAEQFIRYREGYENGDLGRIDAQKIFLCALFESVSRDPSPMKLARIFSSVVGKTDTDIGLADIAELSGMLSDVSPERIYFVTAPGEALVASKSGASYYVLSSKANEEVLCNYFGSVGGFDKNKLFLNTGYESFGAVYNGYSSYSVRSASDIAAGQ